MNTRLLCLTAFGIALLHYGIPALERSEERSIRERELAVKERQVNVLMIAPQPERQRL